MLKTLNSFKIFLVAASTFMTVELADSPFRAFSYLSALIVASGNLWMKTENVLRDVFN